MVDVKITDLSAIASIATEDVIAVIDDPAGTPLSKKGTFTQIVTFLNSVAQTLTNKTISFTSNTISMTLAELNTAVSDANIASLLGAETLDAKTLTGTVRVQNALGTALGTTGTIDLDFSTNELVTMAAMTGNVTFTTSNLAAGRTKTIRIIGGASAYTFTFPAWKFLGAAAPASLAIGKYAVLTLTSISTTDAEVVAAYSAQV